jgi:amino acid transporter
MIKEGLLPTPQSGLRRNYLGFWNIAAQSIANIAPSATPALIVPLVFGFTGNGLWVAYTFATVAMLLVATNINVFAHRSVSPGALYTFVAQGLGPTWGVISGWSLVIAYTIIGSSVLAGLANYVAVLAHRFINTDYDFGLTIVAMLAGGLIAWLLAYRDVKLSTQFMLGTEFVSISIIMLLVVLFFTHHRFIDPPQLAFSTLNANGLAQGLVLAIFSFVGFESATALGHEANNPKRSIPLSVLFTVIATGVYFVITSYTLVNAFHGRTPTLDQSNAPLDVLSQLVGIPWLGLLVDVGITIGFFACALACVTAGARILYAMSRHGLIHSAASMTHKTHATPHIAVSITSIIVIVVPLIMLFARFKVLDIYGITGTLSTFGLLLPYILVSIAAPVYLRQRGEPFGVPTIISVLSLIALFFTVKGSIYPVPAAPYNFLPYIFVGLLLIGLVRFVYVSKKQPRLIESIQADLASEVEELSA